MQTGIIGLKYTGKTTIFNMLTGANAPTGLSGHSETNTGVARIPDERLTRLAELFRPPKTVPAVANFLDLPGVEPGEMKESAFLASLRHSDALAHVVRAFHDEAVPHPAGSIDPRRDMVNLEMEMAFADLFQIERRLERLDKDIKKMRSDALAAEHQVLLRFKAHLEVEKPLRSLELNPEEERSVRGFTFLSQKPILYIINIDEADSKHLGMMVEDYGLVELSAQPKVVVMGVCGKIEDELSQMNPAEAKEFMADLGISEPGTTRILKENFRLLGLISFFTASESEVRAWTIRKGTNAQKAAGAVHSDMEKGFIRAEVAKCEDLLQFGSLHALKEKGLLRLEGKEYIVEDGEIFHIRFNV